MCKKKTKLHIDSNDKTVGSSSSSDFKVTLDKPLTLQNHTGVSVRTLLLPYTLRTINANINDKLYIKLGVLCKKITLAEDTLANNSSALTRLVNDINAKCLTAFPQTPNLYNTANNWTFN